MRKHHDVSNVRFKGDVLTMNVDGRDIRLAPESLPKSLREASEEDRGRFEVSPSGYGIHWPSLDEDLSIDGILGIKHVIPENSSQTRL